MKKPYALIENFDERFVELYGSADEWQYQRYRNLLDKFKLSFSKECAYFASSSGRVEVCGNHTDHNGGKVVSCAISLDTLAAFLPNDKNVICVKSEGYSDIVIDLNKEEEVKIGTSSALVKGVLVGLKNLGYSVGGFDACLTSNVIGGAGISSSASFEVLIAEIINFLYNDGKIDNETKAKVSQFSENVYFNKPCGLLDQTAIAFGGLNVLDFSNKEKISVSPINNVLHDFKFILINTGGSHADLTDEYASIPMEMKTVAKAFNKERLIEITPEEFYKELPNLYDKLPDRAILRAIHFYSENARVNDLYNALSSNDYDKFLESIEQSGISSLYMLQNCFVAGKSKDQPIPKALAIVKGLIKVGASRVHGGGFAGSILCVVKNDCLIDFISGVKRYFSKKDIIPLSVRKVGAIVL